MKRKLWRIGALDRSLCFGLVIACCAAGSMAGSVGEESNSAKPSAEAEEGDADATVRLARRHLTGDGVPKDVRKALDLVKPLAESGNAGAEALLGYLHAQGLGVPKDEAVAIRWFRLAADQGHAVAQLNLGLLLLKRDSSLPGLAEGIQSVTEGL
ncbi:MAG: sel1 repeat family protein, partial [Verrucomicrobiae bacterium]|nr:sel1 repeat family protein [Verrucomicrobiae bacterium]